MPNPPSPEKNAPQPAPTASTNPGPAAEPKPAGPAASELSPEEQMENFARQLKEDDWGHQPC